jgi:DNA-binding transcriptional regulator YiaG
MTTAQIKSARKRLGLSCYEFPAALGFIGKNRHITCWRWENGDRMPSAQTIILIKQLLKAKG